MRKQNRHAYLIMVHNQPELLKMLCELLDHPNVDIYIHVDVKFENFPYEDIRKTVKLSTIYFTERTNVIWGGYSLINCEMILMKAAFQRDDYSYFHLLSGVDLPLKTAEELYECFENSGKEFINYAVYGRNTAWDQEIKNRIAYRYLFIDSLKLNIKRDIKSKILVRSIVELQKLLGVNRIKGIENEIASGANWFSVTRPLVEHILDNENKIKRMFKQTKCADEVFLQTMVRNTEHEKNLNLNKYGKSDNYCNLRYTDWERGNPYVFKEEDFDEIINSGCLFARKFDIDRYPQICYKIYNYLKNTENTK